MAMVCLLILFGPIFAWFYQIDREARSADYVIELFTYPPEEPSTGKLYRRRLYRHHGGPMKHDDSNLQHEIHACAPANGYQTP